MAFDDRDIGYQSKIDLDAVRHPEYLRLWRRWKMAFDFWRGGVHVLEPDWKATTIRWGERLSSGSDGLDSQDDMELSNYRWHSAAVESYLWKHEREGKVEYNERGARSVHYPIFQPIVNILNAGILRQKPRRGADSEIEPWRSYHADVDFTGTDIDALERQTLSLAIVFGRMHAITDRPAFSGIAESREEQMLRGERAYTTLYTPLDVVDWELDMFGRFVWVRIREDLDDWRRFDDESSEPRNQYRVWHRGYWELYKEQKDGDKYNKKWILFDKGRHPVGEVPIATINVSKDGRPASMDCESPLASILDGDRDLFNRMSELDELERLQAWALLWIPVMDGTPMGPLDIGPNRALTGPSDAGSPSFLSPDQQILSGKWSRIAERVHLLRQSSGVGRGRAEYSKEERSADAIAMESIEKLNTMALWVSELEDFDKKIHSHVAAWEGAGDTPKSEFSRSFDIKGLSAQINEILQIASVQEVTSKARAAMVRPVVARMLKENGVAESEIQEVLNGIDEVSAMPMMQEVVQDGD